MKYRADIDGLRALAVLAVVLFHAEFVVFDAFIFPGGYLGVDIFFVVSGYLITSILLKDIRHNTFSLLKFYERRARRILPALTVMIVATIPFAWWFMRPAPLESYSGSLLYTLCFSSNFWFAFEDNYWAESSLVKPLLHTWSLSIEEQFYVLYPFALLGLWKIRKERMFESLAIIGVASLALAHYGAGQFPEATFYLLPTRAWELIAGALIAKWRSGTSNVKTKTWNRFVTAAGAVMIVLPMMVFDDNTRHPSFWTTIPVLGAVLVIAFGEVKDPVSKVLSANICVFTGKISYSLYLWHYPIFAYARILDYESGGLQTLICLFIAVIIACLSYLYIETPFRSSRFSVRALAGFVSASVIFSVCISGFGQMTNGASFRYGQFASLFQSQTDWGCLDRAISFGRRTPCIATDGGNQGEIVLIGDSHAHGFAQAIAKTAEEHSYRVYENTTGGCIFIEGLMPGNGSRDPCQLGGDRPALLNEWLARNEPINGRRVIIWSGYLPFQLHGPGKNLKPEQISVTGPQIELQPIDFGALGTISDRIVNQMQYWAANCDVLVLIYPIPEVGWDVNDRLQTEIESSTRILNENDLLDTVPHRSSLEYYKKRSSESFKILDRVEGNNVVRVRPHEVLCTEDTGDCFIIRDGYVLYTDDNHLSSAGATLIWNAALEHLDFGEK